MASAPLTALYYGQMSLIAPVANLVIALPVQLLTSAGLAAACLPYLPEILCTPIAASAWSVDRAVRWLAMPAWASVDVSAPSKWHIAVFYTLLFTVLLTLSARAHRRRRGGDMVKQEGSLHLTPIPSPTRRGVYARSAFPRREGGSGG
ncbi:MAG: hypothetical protein KatS3mg022_3335 [Armatimonadota bacterium]|nr:MAG: hypothetical protein KatS3mg022_3335 [Armatimonadota bacterium]